MLMIMEVKIHDLTPLKRKLLEADMEHTRILLMDELEQTLDKIKNNRGVQGKIVHLLKQVPGLPSLTVEGFRWRLETLQVRDIDILTYELHDEFGYTLLILKVEDAYFDLVGLAQVPLIGKRLNMLADGKKGFQRKVEKSLRGSYSKDFEILVRSGEAS